jgi:hypothetical protein
MGHLTPQRLDLAVNALEGAVDAREARRPVSAAPSPIAVTLMETWVLPAEASCTLRAISRVAAPCCSIEAMIPEPASSE